MNDLARELNNLNSSRYVKSIQFGLLNPEIIKQGSVCEVIKPETYEGSEPIQGGLFDLRMGGIERGVVCQTCCNKSEICNGHFGHIELALPVFHMHFINVVVKILSCVCIKCSSLLLNKKKVNKLLAGKTGETRFKLIYTICSKNQKASKCCNNKACKFTQPIKYNLLNAEQLRSSLKIAGVEKDTVVAIIAEFKEEAIKDLSVSNRFRIMPYQAFEIFSKITQEDCAFLGFNNDFSRPEWMICSILPVPPPAVRPSVQRENNQRSEDDLTFVLTAIVKANNMLKQKIEKNEEPHKIDMVYNLLQYNVATLVSNKIPGFNKTIQRSGKPIKALRERITGKDARIRGNLMGKRVDWSARTVISVDPNISIEEFGMPKKIAMILTFPEVVTSENLKDLTDIVRNGPLVHPGAKKIDRIEYDCYGSPGPCTMNLKHIDPSSIKLKIGDIVHRHIKNGDICLFNRQPSLHRMSMMAHKANIVENNTFRLNVFVCDPYNADFDGDEMNTHIPESLQTRVELEELTSVPTQIISPGKSIPIITVVQDSLVASFLLSKNKLAMIGEAIFHYLMPVIKLKSNFNLVDIRKQRFWTGLELFSLILPNISLDNGKILIKNGDIISGVLDKKTLGSGKNGIIQAIFNQYGPNICRDFLDNLQRLVICWMEDTGFTIGFGDALPQPNTLSNVREVIEKHIKRSEELITKSQFGLLDPLLSDVNRMINLELELNNIASEIAMDVQTVVNQQIKPNNHFKECVESGSKGADRNLTQIMGAIGQQSINGSRIPFGWNGRTLSHFTKWDNGLVGRGLITSSFIAGMDAHEFFYSAVAARVSMIDSHIKTADSGYIQRKMIKVMEDLKVCYDDTIRDACGNVIQYIYGLDGCDPIYLEHIKIPLYEMNNATFIQEYQWNIEGEWINDISEDKELISKEFAQLEEDRYNLRYKYMKNIRSDDKSVLSPVNFRRLIYEKIDQYHINENDISDMKPKDVIEKVDELVNYTVQYYVNKKLFPILKILIRSFLSSKQCIQKYKLSKSIFYYIVDTIKLKILKAYVNPGEMVGIVAAQSIGEPVTQLTLNTFHNSGVGSKTINVSTGVPRFQEIINLSKSKDMKTRSMTIFLKPEFSNNQTIALEIKNTLEYTTIRDLVLCSEIMYISEVRNGKYMEESDIYDYYEDVMELMDIKCHDQKTLSNWMLWIEFDKELMMQKGIYMQDIYNEIIKNCNVDTEIQCVVPDMNNAHLTMRIRAIKDFEDGEDHISFFKGIADCLFKIPIRGVNGIEKVLLSERNVINYKSDGSIDFNNTKEWVLNTIGSNLIEVLSNYYVDSYRTYTNDILETYTLFGIEGARYLIIQELYETMSAGGTTNIDYRHFSLLADIMTYRGVLMQIQRHGFGKSPNIGPLGRASFEVSDSILVKSCMFAEVDDMAGTSANIITGQSSQFGTNMFELIIDQSKLLPPVSKQEIPIENKEDFDFSNEFADMKLNEYVDSIQSTVVNDNDFVFGINIDNITQLVLPHMIIPKTIKINIINNNNNNINRRRRKK